MRFSNSCRRAAQNKSASTPGERSIPALSNAIFDAVGIRLRHLPFTPDVVLRALREKRANDSQAPNPGSDA